MRLAEFILKETEAVLVEWEAFAATLLSAAAGLSSLALRDHAHGILEAIAHDLSTPQTARQQSEKSKGRAPAPAADAPETAAQTHAVLRARGGFDVNQLVAEYRALRASVLRLWMTSGPLDHNTVVDDVVRFNEAIDQAVAESVSHFHLYVEQARNLLLGTIGHDMRSPLTTILLTATRLAALHAGEEVSEAAVRLIRSGASMQALLDDLLDFSRTRLGVGVKVTPAEVDLLAVASDELEQLRAANPGRRIELAVSGDPHGRWDGARVQQLLRNLVCNAIRHGAPGTPVRVSLRGADDDVRLEVANRGPPIDAAARSHIFDPLQRGPAASAPPAAEAHEEEGPRAGLGLGLFIVREIARAHGGEVDVQSDDGETTFAVRLPRNHHHADAQATAS